MTIATAPNSFAMRTASENMVSSFQQKRTPLRAGAGNPWRGIPEGAVAAYVESLRPAYGPARFGRCSKLIAMLRINDNIKTARVTPR